LAKQYTREEIENKVIEIAEDVIGIDREEITLNSDIIDDLGADSLDQVEMVVMFEEAYNLEISDEEADKLQTIQQAVNYIFERAGK
jgi:acyl carrier protein